MRFDLEQFLAITVALGTGGAIGVAVYSNHEGRAEAAPTANASEESTPDEEPFPEAEPRPEPPPPAAVVAPSPPPMPALDADPEVLDAAPGPQVEGANW